MPALIGNSEPEDVRELGRSISRRLRQDLRQLQAKRTEIERLGLDGAARLTLAIENVEQARRELR